MDYKSIITDENIRVGSPTIKGTRLTVYHVVKGIEGEGLEGYRNEFDLNADVISEAVGYCAEKICILKFKFNYCEGCILRTWQDQNEGNELNLNNATEVIIDDVDRVVEINTENANITNLGSLDELKSDLRGEAVWDIAKSLKVKYKI